jgi:hypothetical protein
MLNQQTIEKLYAMRMRGMADAFTQQQEDPGSAQLGFERTRIGACLPGFGHVGWRVDGRIIALAAYCPAILLELPSLAAQFVRTGEFRESTA